MSDPSGCRTRWSRRKRAAAEPAAAPLPDADVQTPQADAPVPQQADAAALPEMPPLPSLEEITASTDISMFMHPAVPEPLRAAALRRMWAIDPAIRDFVSEAVDYAYDWNTPGGVPGNGPLGPADDVARMIADLFDRPDPEVAEEPSPDGTPQSDPPAAPDSVIDVAEPVQTPAAPSAHVSPASLQSEAGAPEDRDLQPQDDRSGHLPDMPRQLAGIGQAQEMQGSANDLAFASGTSAGDEVPPAGPRRHGGALPA